MSAGERVGGLGGRCAEVYIGLHLLGGAAVLCAVAATWQLRDRRQFFAYLLTAMVASCLKIRLPGVKGLASVGFLFVFIGIVDLGREDAVAISAITAAIQSVWRTPAVKPLRICWSVSSSSFWTYAAATLYGWCSGAAPEPVALGALACSFFAGTAVSIAGVIALTERKRFVPVARLYLWFLPYYLCGTSVAWIIGTMPRQIQWEVPIVCLPIVYLIHHSYARHLAQMEQEKKHAEEMSGLHLRTIATLAAAIDARDHETHEHLARVQVYAVAIGEELGLAEPELDALRAASLLHDIGKLAVPDHILLKPGKLTPAEFDQMKLHPLIGAEILENVGFPYPVAPIVRAHHERWNGSGYPDGLRGEAIPVGARILAAVDCLDALASARQYRRALPLDEAMRKIASESGTSFDPRILEILERRYRDLEARAKAESAAGRPLLSRQARIECGAPAAGYAAAITSADLQRLAAHTPPATHVPDLEGREQLAKLAHRLLAAIPCEALAFFRRRDSVLRAEFTAGPAAALLDGIEFPYGAGLAGWVAEVQAPIVNGDPAVEPGWPAAELFRSALVAPVALPDGMADVVGLYRTRPEAFAPADLARAAHALSWVFDPAA